MYASLSTSPYCTLWCKSYQMNNNLYCNRHHPQEVSAKHAEIIKKVPACGRPQGPLPPPSVRRCAHLTNPPSPHLCRRPLWTVPWTSCSPIIVCEEVNGKPPHSSHLQVA